MNDPNNTPIYISCPSCGEIFNMDTSHTCKKKTFSFSTDKEQELLNRLDRLDKKLEELERILEGMLENAFERGPSLYSLIFSIRGEEISYPKDEKEVAYNNGIERAVTILKRYDR